MPETPAGTLEYIYDNGNLAAAIGRYFDPNLRQTLAEARAIKSVALQGSRLDLVLDLGFPVSGYATELTAALQSHLIKDGFTLSIDLTLESQILSHAVQRGLTPLQGIRNIIAVASGKGGVGKSTVAVNLALAWASQGARVGLLDADIYGPSQPIMLGLAGERPNSRDGKRLVPLSAHGIVAMSIGFLVDVEQPMVWRGPMVTSALNQLLADTEWGDLDYLVVDMPPGTGDIQLTLSQRVPVSGAVIVTTPQDISLADARKGLRMFEKVNVPVLGIIENMSVHVCSNCGHTEHIFGAGGGERLATQHGIQLLGSLPLDSQIREEADGGKPTVVSAPESARAAAYFTLARRTAGELARRSRDRSGSFPKIIIEDT
ncbi:MAG: iron-sulfur cluster carrier protein ApbC [Gammaproteobacteria bacterium]|nr:iron-sulfur cluster carrier protein ApbC [Gammaproteobacteria bacterium]